MCIAQYHSRWVMYMPAIQCSVGWSFVQIPVKYLTSSLPPSTTLKLTPPHFTSHRCTSSPVFSCHLTPTIPPHFNFNFFIVIEGENLNLKGRRYSSLFIEINVHLDFDDFDNKIAHKFAVTFYTLAFL